MSVTHNRKKDGISAEGLAAFRASLLEEFEHKQAESEESIITSIRENLVSAPVEGEAWNERKSYITGDTATDDGVSIPRFGSAAASGLPSIRSIGRLRPPPWTFRNGQIFRMEP